MTEEITATQNYDVPTAMRGWHWHSWKVRRRHNILFGIAFLLLAFPFLADAVGRREPQIDWSGLWPSVGLLGFGFCVRYSTNFLFARSIRSSPICGREIHFTIDETRIQIDGPGLESRFEWPFLLKSLITPEGVLLYPQKLAFNWLPKTSFACTADYQRFLELLKAKTKHSTVG